MLSEIVKKTEERLKENLKNKSLDDLKKEVSKSNKKDFTFFNALNENSFSIIAEVKKASPSKGLISKDFDYLSIAKEYESAGASAISVLTEPYFFKGKNSYLSEISKNTSIPILRKDFIINEYMIYESKLISADAILLIVAILNKEDLKKYIEIAEDLGLSVLVEAHSKEEVEIAISAGANIIGINNRDLKTFNVDLNTSLNLKKSIPKNIIAISESGIKNNEDILILKENDFYGVLIGETFMKSDNRTQLIGEFKND